MLSRFSRYRRSKSGRILALQGQNPGQLSFELIRSSGRICPEPRYALSFSVLELSLEKAVQPDIILSGSAQRKQNHGISFSSQRCHSPGTKDSYTHPTTPSAGRTGGVLTCLTKSQFITGHACFPGSPGTGGRKAGGFWPFKGKIRDN